MAATAAVYNRLHNSSTISGGGVGLGVGMMSSSGGHQLARSLERILEEAHYSGELILTNRKLKDFPKTGTKYNLNDTVIADLSRNRFCELPEEITMFSFLETLLLYHNTIRSIPESVKQLTSLTYLDLRSNQLSSLPREICLLPLQVLLVSNNRLHSLPDELGRMDRLTDLDASYNQLTALPARIGELRSLRSLSLRSNQLMYLTRELTCLTLVSLDVSNNRISSLPLEIRQMITLVEFNLENNPLTSPPASLCVRGLVHVFKFLETQAVKDEKGSRAGGNYDGYTTLRRTPRNNSYGNMLESNRVPKHAIDSGYSTCDGIDKRWSHDMPSAKPKTIESPARRMPTIPPNSLSAELMDASLTSSSSTIVDESISLSGNVGALESLHNSEPNLNSASLKRNQSPIPPATLNHHQQQQQQHINNYTQSSSSNGSSPDQDDIMIDHHEEQQQQQQHQNTHNGKADEKHNKNLGNIQTYREYKEALKQQRNLEISSVYKIKGQKTLYDMSEASNALNSSICVNSTTASTVNATTATTTTATTTSSSTHEEIEIRFTNGITAGTTLPKSIMKQPTNSLNGTFNGFSSNGAGGDADNLVIPKKPIQKVIPSRQLRDEDNSSALSLTNGDCSGYVKPKSPMKSANGGTSGGILSNNNKFNTLSGGLKSPGSGNSTSSKLGPTKTHRTVTWNHDIPPEKLSFTMRREFDRQREETELMTQLRSIIETRLKMSLPEDIAAALTDGVILCHLANYVRPRSVASIHVPSPGVSKLTMARCRRNVDNFLEACRKIGVDEELICSCADIVPPNASDDFEDNNEINEVNGGVCNNNSCNNNNNNNNNNENLKTRKLPNPSAVLKTISALIAMDKNPHHQNIKNLQQQKEFQAKLQEQQLLQQQQQLKQQQQQQTHYYQNLCNNKEEAVEQEQQTTATCTKEQMMMLQSQQKQQKLNLQLNEVKFKVLHEDEEVELYLFNGNNHLNNGYDVGNNEVEVDMHDDVVDDSVASVDSEQHINSVTNFLRNAKVKTFEKIKKNLMTSHGNSSNSYAITTQTGAATLHTIVEGEQDTGNTNGGTISRAGIGGGAYRLINECSSGAGVGAAELTLGVNGVVATLSEDMQDDEQPIYKLYLSNIDSNEKSTKAAGAALVSKRIEFFEHSKVATVATTNKTASSGTATAAAAAEKPKTKTSIFSIYHANNDHEKLLVKHEVAAALEQEAGSSLLKHDSHVLTIVLSCIFIVTFLLLVFFPLPA